MNVFGQALTVKNVAELVAACSGGPVGDAEKEKKLIVLSVAFAQSFESSTQ